MLDPIITSSLMTFGAGFATAAFSKAKGPGQALDDAMALVGFDKLHEVAEKKRAKRELNMQRYKDSIAQKIVAIPDGNLKEPPLSIVGPALEASKYYIEEEELREMFARLIASSMDKAKETITHTSYVEIIKQLTPLDGDNLKLINQNKGEELISRLIVNFDNEGFKIARTNLFLANENCNDQLILSASLDNLNRLGLVTLDYSRYRKIDNIYDQFKLTKEYEDLKHTIESQNQHLENNELPSENYPFLSGPEIGMGLVSITSFGENFCATCL
jgi:hypothetical protein|nr:MAG TPA: protein of unknown function (DUF4393) [Bacteriophage sp.]